MGRILDLPEELVSNVASKLGCDDKCALRLTCRTLDERSFHEFGTEHFSEKGVHFNTDSLKTLVDISHSRLSKYVKEVSIVIALFSEQGFSCPGRETAHWRPSVRQSEAYKFYIQDQATLRSTGNDKKMLIEAFKSLPSLKVVEFVDTETALKPSVDYRGARKVARQTGTRPINGLDSSRRLVSQEFRKHFEHVWFTLLCSLAGAHEHLSLDELRAKCLSQQNFISPRQFSLRQSTLQRLSSVLKNTSRLHLDLKTPPDGRPYRDIVSRFSATMPNLRHLSLYFDGLQNSGLLCHRLTSAMDLSHLTSLSINAASISATRLIKLISSAPELKELKLENVDLLEGTWPSVLKSISQLDHVDHLHLMYLREDGCKCFFIKQIESEQSGALMNNPFEHAFDNDWEDDYNSIDDTDEDDDDDDDSDGPLPNLEPSDDPLVSALPADNVGVAEPAHGTGEQHSSGDNNDSAHIANDAQDKAKQDEEDMPDYVPSGTPREYGGERGFYVCVEGHSLVMKRLQTFIDEYNVGESIPDPGADAFPGFGGIAMGGGGFTIPLTVGGDAQAPPAQTNFNAFMTAMAQGLGIPPHPANHAPGGANNANAPPAAATTTTTTAGAAADTGATTAAANTANTTATAPTTDLATNVTTTTLENWSDVPGLWVSE